MNNLLNRFLLRQKFLLLALLGGVMVLIPTLLFLNEANKAITVAQLETQGIAPARALLNVAHLIQQHRGLSAILLNGNPAIELQISTKHQEVADAIAQMDAHIRDIGDHKISSDWRQLREQWNELSASNAQKSLSAADDFAAHTKIVEQLLVINESVIDHFGLRLDPEADSYYLVDAILVRSPVLRETLGQLRGLGSGILVAGSAGVLDRILIGSRGDRAADYYRVIDNAMDIAMTRNPRLHTRLADLVQANHLAGEKMVQLAQEQIARASSTAIPVLEYYRQFSETIDAQFKMSEVALGELDDLLVARANSLLHTEYKLVAALALLFLGALAIGRLTIRSVTKTLDVALDAARLLTSGASEKIEVADAIAKGELERELALTQIPAIDASKVAQDELGELLGSVMRMGQMQQQFDLAFRQMTLSLRESSAQEQARDWLKSSQNELNICMRGEQETHLLASKVLSYLCERLDAKVGSFYLFNETIQALELTARYAIPDEASLETQVKSGQGLLGQAILEQKTIILNEVPSHYLSIGSGLGKATVSHILVLPLMHGENLIGALEMGSFHGFTHSQQNFLETVKESIAIGFDVSLSRQRTRDLLSETEQQAEELRVQQEELQQSNEELEERAEMLERQREQIRAKNIEVEEASREIQDKAEELQRISTYKSEFMANMSHELRTPLNSMLILSGLLSENKSGNLSEKQVDFARTINSAGKDLLNLINDILDLAKVEAGQVEFHYEDCHTSEILASMENLFHSTAEQKRLRLTLTQGPEVPEVLHIDSQRTQQILKNLLANALKFTSEGEISLHLYLSAANANPLNVEALACAVSDTGIGVPPDKQQLIFEAFKQADGSISRNYGGTGLGLSISLQLAHRMGGNLTMQSQPGKGSTFTLFLPLPGKIEPKPVAPLQVLQKGPVRLPSANAEPAEPDAPAAPQPTPLSKAPEAIPVTQQLPIANPVADDRALLTPSSKSILIVEDDVGFARILMDFVRQRSFGALVATDGESGIAMAETYLPSAVLLDVMLPGTDGWGVMRRLKDNPRTRHIPVHFISCLEERKRAMDMGAIGYVTKPVGPEQLDKVFSMIEETLDKSVRQLLIVEDDPVEAQSLQALLSDRDIVITLAATGHEAIKHLETQRFDCMVLDLGLADMSGNDLLSHIQHMEQTRRLPVIIHSGRELTREQERELNHFAESIIIKGAKSPERLLNEVTLFLHMVESKLAPAHQRMIRAAIDKEAAFEGKKMLVVDDDIRNVFSMTSLLMEKGIEVIEAENGKEALKKLSEHPDVCLVLMDIMMPEMDGYETIRQIRLDSRFTHLPIIAMTAKVMKGDNQKCIDAGASDYIGKPIDTDKLMSLLRVWAGQ